MYQRAKAALSLEGNLFGPPPKEHILLNEASEEIEKFAKKYSSEINVKKLLFLMLDGYIPKDYKKLQSSTIWSLLIDLKLKYKDKTIDELNKELEKAIEIRFTTSNPTNTTESVFEKGKFFHKIEKTTGKGFENKGFYGFLGGKIIKILSKHNIIKSKQNINRP